MNEFSERQMLGARALDSAEDQLKLHYFIGGLDHTSVVSRFAALLCSKRTEDDADPLGALVKVMALLLDDQVPSVESRYDPESDSHQTMRVTKAQMLTRAVEALEGVVGRQFQRPPNIGEALVNLNEAGDLSAVRPEDVPEELADHTMRFWQQQHARWSEQFNTILPEAYSEDDATRAKLLVAEARIAGAFIKAYEEMPSKQQLFWLQRAAGFEHRLV